MPTAKELLLLPLQRRFKPHLHACIKPLGPSDCIDMTNLSTSAKSSGMPAPLDRPLSSKKIAMAVVVGVLLVAGASTWLWHWVNGTPFTGEQKATAHLDIIKVSASLIVMLGGLGALYLTMRRQRTQENQLAHAKEELEHARLTAAATERDAEAKRVTEQYSKSVEQLGSDKAPVRLGGLYALERLAQANPDQRQTVINVLCAYLRMPYSPPNRELLNHLEDEHEERILSSHSQGRRALPEPAELTKERDRYNLQQQEQEVRIAARRILASHLRPMIDRGTGEPANPGYWSGQLRVDLTGALLADADFGGCQFAEAVFDRARFQGTAKFAGASFPSTARFCDSTFTGPADFSAVRFFRQAVFTGAAFRGNAVFVGSGIADADFSNCTFSEAADFASVTFDRSTTFDKAILRAEAAFSRAMFKCGANFNHVSFVGDVIFSAATFGDTARFLGAEFHAGADFADIVNPHRVKLTHASAAADTTASRTWPHGLSLGTKVPDDRADDEEVWLFLAPTTS